MTTRPASEKVRELNKGHIQAGDVLRPIKDVSHCLWVSWCFDNGLHFRTQGHDVDLLDSVTQYISSSVMIAGAEGVEERKALWLDLAARYECPSLGALVQVALKWLETSGLPSSSRSPESSIEAFEQLQLMARRLSQKWDISSFLYIAPLGEIQTRSPLLLCHLGSGSPVGLSIILEMFGQLNRDLNEEAYYQDLRQVLKQAGWWGEKDL